MAAVKALPAQPQQQNSFAGSEKIVDDQPVLDETAPGDYHADDNIKAEIGIKSWLAVMACCFGIIAQVYLVVGPASVIAFIGRDLGFANIGWILQAPLLMQAVLSPIVGRLSDLKNRKWVAFGGPVVAVVGCIISARAKDMNTLIGAGILIGVTLPTIAVITAIPNEILPLKWRPVANGMCYVGGNIGGWAGGLAAGAAVKTLSWRWIYWIQGILHLVTAILILVFYNPPKIQYPKLSFGELLWAVDTIGSGLFAIGSTLTLLALNWAGSSYPWKSAHVLACLIVGLCSLVAFGVYEWKGRTDGIVTHAFFARNRNFALSVIAFATEGYLFFGAVNLLTNQIVLNLGFQTDAFLISIRQLVFSISGFISSLILTFWATKTKDLKTPLIVSFVAFLASTITYGFIKPTHAWNIAQTWPINIVTGFGQAGPLTLIVSLVQFCSPHSYLATATGLAFSARAIGGAFGSAVLNAVVDGKLASYPEEVGGAAVAAGLPEASVPSLVAALQLGLPFSTVDGLTDSILAVAVTTSRNVYAHAYRIGWLQIIPFIVISIIAVAMLKGVKELMTNHVEAPVEDVHKHNLVEGDSRA